MRLKSEWDSRYGYFKAVLFAFSSAADRISMADFKSCCFDRSWDAERADESAAFSDNS